MSKMMFLSSDKFNPNKVILPSVIIVVFCLALTAGLTFFNSWGYVIKWQSPIVTRAFVYLEPRPQPFISAVVANAKVIEAVKPNGDFEELVYALWGSEWQNALKVVSCENGARDMSRINVNTDGSKDYGAFQINDLNGARDKQFGTGYKTDILENARVAYVLYRNGNGWGAWYSSRSCHGLN